jgi:hypothetical protein
VRHDCAGAARSAAFRDGAGAKPPECALEAAEDRCS